ncbi:MAG: hypothetical protein ABIU84_17055, partial [Thermoanaerobaculia bacterium]
MSLRRRLFLLLGGLICLLLVGQWLLFRSLTQAVTDDVRTLAFRVGEEILSGFSYRTESLPRVGPPSGEGAAADANGTQTHVVIVTSESEGASAEPQLLEALPGSAASGWTEVVEPPPAGESQRLVMRREVHLRTPAPRAVVAGESATKEAPTEGVAEPPGTHLRKMVLETDEARDVLFVRGPAMKRAIPIPNAAIASTLDRFGSQLLIGNLALLAAGL